MTVIVSNKTKCHNCGRDSILDLNCANCTRAFMEGQKCEYNKRAQINDLLLGVLWQACGEPISEEKDAIDNRAISIYEAACSYLEKRGLLTKKNDRIYFFTEKAKEMAE